MLPKDIFCNIYSTYLCAKRAEIQKIRVMSERTLKTCRSQISDICIMQRTESSKKRLIGKNKERRELDIYAIVMHSTHPTDF